MGGSRAVATSGGPDVSVLIPVFNGANYLREAIESVFAQTYPRYELIVIDDGSTDDTWDCIQSYGARLRGLRKPNGGVASALNQGIRAAAGEYIAWLSHDDVFLPDKLAVQVARLAEAPEAHVCYSDYWVMDEHGRRLQVFRAPAYPRERLAWHLFQCMFVCGSTTLVHRSCFEADGLFEETLRETQDADMWLRLARHFTFVHVPEPLTAWRYHPAQGSRDERKMLRGERAYLRRCLASYALEDFFPELAVARDRPRAEARARHALARVLLARYRSVGLALGQLARAVVAWPRPGNVALWRALALALGGGLYYSLGRTVMRRIRAAAPRSPVPRIDIIAASRLIEDPRLS